MGRSGVQVLHHTYMRTWLTWVADTLLLQGKVYLIMCVYVCLFLIKTSLCIWTLENICPCRHLGVCTLKVPIDRNSITERAEKLLDKADMRIFEFDLHECKYVHSNICKCVYGQGKVWKKLENCNLYPGSSSVPNATQTCSAAELTIKQEVPYSYGTQAVTPKSHQFPRKITFTWCLVQYWKLDIKGCGGEIEIRLLFCCLTAEQTGVSWRQK